MFCMFMCCVYELNCSVLTLCLRNIICCCVELFKMHSCHFYHDVDAFN
jgi:hypothetical protein